MDKEKEKQIMQPTLVGLSVNINHLNDNISLPRDSHFLRKRAHRTNIKVTKPALWDCGLGIDEAQLGFVLVSGG